jgi:AraC-like DNA-binding protein
MYVGKTCGLKWNGNSAALVDQGTKAASLDRPSSSRNGSGQAGSDGHVRREPTLGAAPKHLGRSISAAVAEVLERLGHPNVSIDRVAAELAVSVRTMQLALAQEETCFRTIRRRRQIQDAMTLLTITELRIANIAKLAGYTNLANFYRAFGAVTDTTPARFRIERQQERHLAP